MNLPFELRSFVRIVNDKRAAGCGRRYLEYLYWFPDIQFERNICGHLDVVADRVEELEARAYELTRQEIGLDIAQRWRAAADTVFFWARSHFIVVSWREADRKALQEFTRALENRLNGR